MIDNRNQTERLLNAAMDHICDTHENPTDQRAWDHLLVYCPKEAIERRMGRFVQQKRKHDARSLGAMDRSGAPLRHLR